VKCILFATGRLARVKKKLGNVILSDLTDDRIRAYIRQRQAEKVSGRTINMDIGELSRAIGQPWSLLWRKVRKLEERRDVGRALSPTDQKALLNGLKDRRTPHLNTLVPLLLLTGMRACEALSLTWAQIDLVAPILIAHRVWFVEEFGEPRPEHHLFPWGKPVPSDPTRHAPDITWGWDHLRTDTGVKRRLAGPMLERYSHIRIAAKRDAMAGIRLHEQAGKSGTSGVVPVKVPVVEQSAAIH
jgi:hypothetical protein